MQSDYYNENLTNYLKQKDSENEHESSGKISPSKLTKPTLEAVLQLLGVQADPPSDQSLRYFIRGNLFEELAIKAITLGRQTYTLQAACSYRGGKGLIDVFQGMPHEIKSAGKWTFATVKKNGQPMVHHSIQAAWYALAKKCDSAWVHYIDTDTLQLLSFKIKASDYKTDVDSRTDSIIASFMAGTLPDYVALDPFHKSIKYSDYAMFFNKKGIEAENILKQYYPREYALLKSKTIYERIK
jgi:hypothetical protein